MTGLLFFFITTFFRFRISQSLGATSGEPCVPVQLHLYLYVLELFLMLTDVSHTFHERGIT